MAWIESHQTLREHPKLYQLSESLGVSKAQTIGHLHLLWWWCVDYSPEGMLRVNDLQIARAAEWSGEPKLFVESLVAARFLDRRDGVLTIHDWMEFCGSLIHKRLERKAERRTIGAERSPTNQPNRTQPNRTQPTNPERVKWFEEAWGKYPSKDGKKHAQRHYLASVSSEEHRQQLLGAMQNYLRCGRVAGGYVKNGSTWFNEWQDWISPTEQMMKGGNGTTTTHRTGHSGNSVSGGIKPEPGKYDRK